MAITKSAKKALRQSLRKKSQNAKGRDGLRNAMKTARKGTDKTVKTLGEAYKAIDKALKRGLIKKNTAARRKALASKLLKK
ncbi:MAG TPA: 30S ribosomal protein S20 [Candidatus Paceibacterota bacterium]|jgi:ribosomal protein S20|nr:30S ribosomal protein S20 [Candidatus Paceibacterota bacterium]